MEELKIKSSLNLLSPAQKRQLTILRKREAKIQSKINYILKHGEQNVKLAVAKRARTIENKNPLPHYIEDNNKPIKKSRDERIELKANNKYISKSEPGRAEFKRYITSALNNSFKEITIENDDFSIVSLMYNGMEEIVPKSKAKIIDYERKLVPINNLVNTTLICNTIEHELLKIQLKIICSIFMSNILCINLKLSRIHTKLLLVITFSITQKLLLIYIHQIK